MDISTRKKAQNSHIHLVAYSHGNIYWCPIGDMRIIDSFRKPL